MKKLVICFISIFILSNKLALALDWKTLHGVADGVVIQEISDPLSSMYVAGLKALNQYDTAQAKAVFEQVLMLDPKSVEGKWGQAEVLRREHKLKESEEILVELIQDNPKFAPAYITLAFLKYINMEFKESVYFTTKVIAMGEVNVDLSNMVRAHGLYAAAKGMLAFYGSPINKMMNFIPIIKHLNIAKKLDPESATVNYGFGSYYMLMPPVIGQDLNKAEDYLKQTIARDPLFPDPYVRLAQIYKKRGDLKAYEENLNKALALDAGNELAIDIKTNTCNFICLE